LADAETDARIVPADITAVDEISMADRREQSAFGALFSGHLKSVPPGWPLCTRIVEAGHAGRGARR
jgi:hypothetical protein